MKKLRSFFEWIKTKYDILSEKKYTTLAGTLVYFLIMSITPLAFWLTLLFGRLDDNARQLLELPVFESVKDILLFISEEATNATSGASLFLIATTLYSATNLFYHMRRSGEIIYAYKRRKHGLWVRLGALLSMFAMMFLFAIAAAIFTGGAFLFAKLFPKWLEICADYMLLLAVAFGAALLLNIYICPYRTKVRALLPGTLVTVGAWAIALVGFAVYLKLGNMRRLYGALSAIIAFMLWLYVLMICFLAGVIFNSQRVSPKESKKL